MIIHVTREVWVPDDATHYSGDLAEEGEASFYKMTTVGVAGEHWWFWNSASQEWTLQSHQRPHWIKPLSKEFDLLRLLCLADEVIMKLHGCFPLDGDLHDKCLRIRAATGDDYARRLQMAAEAMR